LGKGAENWQAGDQQALDRPTGAVTRFELGEIEQSAIAIQAISQDGENQVGQVSADLVGAPGMGNGLHQGEASIVREHVQLGVGGFAPLGVHHSAAAPVAVLA
jgi:hypothetical protein